MGGKARRYVEIEENAQKARAVGQRGRPQQGPLRERSTPRTYKEWRYKIAKRLRATRWPGQASQDA